MGRHLYLTPDGVVFTVQTSYISGDVHCRDITDNRKFVLSEADFGECLREPLTFEWFLKTGHRYWEALIDNVPAHDREKVLAGIAQKAEFAAQQSAAVSFYLLWRAYTGANDQGHDKAVEQMKKKLLLVRRALGFSYP